MLLPDQVRPFLGHPDPILRGHAISYFLDTADFGSLTADDYWEQLDGKLLGPAERLSFVSNLSQAPQTDASVARLIRGIKHPESADILWHYQSVVRQLDMPMLIAHREAVLGCSHLSPETRRHLELRLSLLEERPQTCWERLVALGRSYSENYTIGFDDGEFNALIEAAARGGDAVCKQAVRAMRDQSGEMGWADVLAVRVIGRARYEPAVGPLVENYLIDTDLLRDETNRALSRIGTVGVIDRIVSLYPGKPWHVRLYADDPLEHIKRPESEAGLMKLLAWELEPKPDGPSVSEDRDGEGEPLAGHLLIGLANLCSLAGIDVARKELGDNEFVGDMTYLAKALIASAVMQGVSLPEEQQWRERIRTHEAESKMRAAWFDRMIGATGKSLTGQTRLQPAKGEPADTKTLETYEPGVRIAPIRNTAPKVGRNDPCPCGSGKKYKKCCG